MKSVLLIAIFFLSLLSSRAQCAWSLGVSSQNNSFTLTCNDTLLSMQAVHNCTNPVSFQWNGPGGTSTSSILSVNQPGNYYLSVTDIVTSCVNTQSFAVSVNSVIPVFNINALSSVWTCLNNGGTYTATAITPTSNISFSWYDINSPPPNPPMYWGQGMTSLFVPPYPGGFIAELKDGVNGCAATKTIIVNANLGLPTFSVIAAHNFQLGCWPADTLYITNVVLTNINATASYSFTQYLPLPVGIPGLPLSSTPSIVVNAPSVYTVVVQDDYNFCQTAMAVVVAGPSSLNIAYNYSVAPNGVVNFSSTSVGTSSNTTYLWDYGDGTTGTGVTSSHTYSNGGVHFVSLQTNNPNCVSSSDTVNVNTIPCLANSNFSLTYSGTPQFWYAVPDYYGNVTNAIWNWGDGTSTNAMFPSHTYSAAGLYNICLTVTVSCANSSSTCANYNIYKVVSDQQIVNVTVVKSLPLGVGLKETIMINDPVRLLPNPANDYLFIEGIREGRANFYNNLGKLVLTEVIDNREIKTKIPITVLSSGVYFVHISGGNESIVKKIVISH